MQSEIKKPAIIIFDDLCLLCNKTVKFIIKHDKEKLFYFTGIQTPLAQELRRIHKLTEIENDTVIMCRDHNYYLKTHAFIEIFSSFGGAWKLISILKVVPSFISNGFYDLFAKRRHHLFGRSSTCLLPTQETQERFIDQISKLKELHCA